MHEQPERHSKCIMWLMSLYHGSSAVQCSFTLYVRVQVRQKYAGAAMQTIWKFHILYAFVNYLLYGKQINTYKLVMLKLESELRSFSTISSRLVSFDGSLTVLLRRGKTHSFISLINSSSNLPSRISFKTSPSGPRTPSLPRSSWPTNPSSSPPEAGATWDTWKWERFCMFDINSLKTKILK